MGFTYRSKRVGYDNISVGNAAGFERHIANGSTDNTGETTRLTLSQRGTSTSALSQGMPEQAFNISGPTVSDNDNYINKPSTDTSPQMTSGTSNTSVFYERVG